MQQARMLGNYVQHLVEAKHISNEQVCNIIDCTDYELLAFYKGRMFFTFEQISKLAILLETTVGRLLKGDVEQYEASVVQCSHSFNHSDNREKILDIIDNYLDIKESLSECN